jgi:hypothetical protein
MVVLLDCSKVVEFCCCCCWQSLCTMEGLLIQLKRDQSDVGLGGCC